MPLSITMHRIPTLESFLWGAGFVGHLVLLTVLLLRRRARSFPVFTSLIAYEAMTTVILFLSSRTGFAGGAYKTAYWILAPGDFIFQIALILEMASIVLRPSGSLAGIAKKAFLIWSVAGVTVAGLVSWAIVLPSLTAADLWGVRATVFTSLLTCMTFLAMSAAVNRLGLFWSDHVMALGQGLASWSLVALLDNVVQYASAWRGDFVLFDRLERFTYLGVLSFWIVSFWRSERRPTSLSPDLETYLALLQGRTSRASKQANVGKKSR